MNCLLLNLIPEHYPYKKSVIYYSDGVVQETLRPEFDRLDLRIKLIHFWVQHLSYRLQSLSLKHLSFIFAIIVCATTLTITSSIAAVATTDGMLQYHVGIHKKISQILWNIALLFISLTQLFYNPLAFRHQRLFYTCICFLFPVCVCIAVGQQLVDRSIEKCVIIKEVYMVVRFCQYFGQFVSYYSLGETVKC